MIHLTLCGYYAGRPLCDCDKSAELSAGHSFQHAMFTRDMTDPNICPKCMAEWNAAADDNDAPDEG